MKIKVVCPTVKQSDPAKPWSEKNWREMFTDGRKSIVHGDTDFEVDVCSYLNKGVHSFESIYDLEIGAAFAIPTMEKAEKENYDAVALDCAADQGLYGAKEALDIPVVGAMESAMAIACLLGRKFSILTIHPGLKRIIERQLLIYEMEHRCASVRDVGGRVENVEAEMDDIIEAWITEGKKAVTEDDADVIIIGGTLLSCSPGFVRLKQAMSEIGVPVLCGGETAVKVAEVLVALGLKQSKKRFPKPPEKERFL